MKKLVENVKQTREKYGEIQMPNVNTGKTEVRTASERRVVGSRPRAVRELTDSQLGGQVSITI